MLLKKKVTCSDQFCKPTPKSIDPVEHKNWWLSSSRNMLTPTYKLHLFQHLRVKTTPHGTTLKFLRVLFVILSFTLDNSLFITIVRPRMIYYYYTVNCSICMLRWGGSFRAAYNSLKNIHWLSQYNLIIRGTSTLGYPTMILFRIWSIGSKYASKSLREFHMDSS